MDTSAGKRRAKPRWLPAARARRVSPQGTPLRGLGESRSPGFTEHFGVRGDQLHGFESGRTFGANDVTIREYDRFEGVSDPDDMAIVYAIESSSGTRGRLSTPLACIRIRRSAQLPGTGWFRLLSGNET